MRKVLVTGGIGYIGSHTVVELMKNGYEVVIIDNLCNSYPEVLDGIEKITGKRPVFCHSDLRHKIEVQAVFDQHKDIESVIHFAALKSVGESMQKPLEYYENNVTCTAILLEVMVEYRIKSLVFSSSCTVYGEPYNLPVKESMPAKKPASTYGNTKKICEEIIEDAVRAYNINAISLRYFNPIGAHSSAMIGELPIGVPNNLMPIITQTAIGKREKMYVWGNDYDTPDGSCIRDYIHVVDLAEAHRIAVERFFTGKMKRNYEIFNLGTGHGNSVFEVISAFEKNTGIKLNYEIAARREGDVTSIYSDTTLANKELGWMAKHNLDEMVLSSWNWEKNILQLYPYKF